MDLVQWDNAAVQGIPVFVGESSLHFRYLAEALYQMEDFRLFGIHWQLLAAKQNLKRTR